MYVYCIPFALAFSVAVSVSGWLVNTYCRCVLVLVWYLLPVLLASLNPFSLCPSMLYIISEGAGVFASSITAKKYLFPAPLFLARPRPSFHDAATVTDGGGGGGVLN